MASIPSGGATYSPFNIYVSKGCDLILELPQVVGITNDSVVTLYVNDDSGTEVQWEGVVAGGKVTFRVDAPDTDVIPQSAPYRIRVSRPSPTAGEPGRTDDLPWLKGVIVRDD